MTLKAILFDHDGTLVNSELTHYAIWKDILSAYGIDYTEQAYKDNCSGVPTPANAMLFIKRYTIEETVESLIEQKEKATVEHLENQPFPLMPFAIETIKSLYDAGYKLGMVTGAGRLGVMSTLRSYELEKYFSVITTGDDVEKSKPHPDVYQLAVKRLGVSSSECVAFEDTVSGVRSAISAGIACCAIASEFSEGHDFSLANKLAANLSEAREWAIGL